MTATGAVRSRHTQKEPRIWIVRPCSPRQAATSHLAASAASKAIWRLKPEAEATRIYSSISKGFLKVGVKRVFQGHVTMATAAQPEKKWDASEILLIHISPLILGF